MLLVHGFNRREEILAQCYGKDSAAYTAGMASAAMAFEKLFALLPENPKERRPDGQRPTDRTEAHRDGIAVF